VDVDGNIYVTGESFGISTNYDFATVKYDSAGVMHWVVRYNGPGNGIDAARSLSLDEYGNIYVTGESARAFNFPFHFNYATIKYNSIGQQLWVARYNGPGNTNDYAYDLAVDGYGNTYVTGESWKGWTETDIATLKYTQPSILNWESPTASLFGAPLPSECRLEPPSPNPFNPETVVSYKLKALSHVSLRVYDAAGREVRTLVEGWREAGEQDLTFDATGMAAGVYFVRLQAAGTSQVQKLVLLK